MSRKARVGLLLLAGVALFMLAIFFLAERSFLLSDTFTVKARYSRVAGLQAGASVQYQGVSVGRVESVQLPDAPGGDIVVTMAIREAAQHLLHENTLAQIKSDGLVGNQIVVLADQRQTNPVPIDEGDFIEGVDPFDLYEITDRAMASVKQFENAAVSFKQIMDDVQSGTGTLGRIVYDPELYEAFVATTQESQRVLNTLGDNAEALVALAGEATQGVQSILTKVDEGDGTLAKLINDPAVYNQLLASSDTLLTMTRDLRAITQSAENAANWGALGAFRFSELMEAAKHNWLFKRYFEERGFTEQASFEMREQAIQQAYQELEQRTRELEELEERLRNSTTETGAETEAAAAGAAGSSTSGDNSSGDGPSDAGPSDPGTDAAGSSDAGSSGAGSPDTELERPALGQAGFGAVRVLRPLQPEALPAAPRAHR